MDHIHYRVPSLVNSKAFTTKRQICHFISFGLNAFRIKFDDLITIYIPSYFLVCLLFSLFCWCAVDFVSFRRSFQSFLVPSVLLHSVGHGDCLTWTFAPSSFSWVWCASSIHDVYSIFPLHVKRLDWLNGQSMNPTLKFDNFVFHLDFNHDPLRRWTKINRTPQNRFPLSFVVVASFGFVCVLLLSPRDLFNIKTHTFDSRIV